jgi:DNA-binding IclR family transcriptional regulator
VYIGTIHDGRVLIIHHVFRPDDSLQVLQVGSAVPLASTALGKVLLAFDAEGDDLARRATLEPHTKDTVVTEHELIAQLARMRDDGWGAEIEELVEGEASIAAPIRDERNITLGAIGIRGAIERLCTPDGEPRAELVSYVRDAARAVSRDLGAHRW